MHTTGLLLLSNPIGHVLGLEVIDDKTLLLITVVKLMVVKFAGIRGAQAVAHLKRGDIVIHPRVACLALTLSFLHGLL